MHNQHIIVIGSGLVGATFMVSAIQLACHITLLDKASLVSAPDERPISLSYPTIIFLKNLGLWASLEKHATPILQVHVSEQDRLGSLLLKASDTSYQALGYVIPYHVLEKTLYEHAIQSDYVKRIVVDDIVNIDETDQVAVTFVNQKGEQIVVADQLIAADGVNSRCRQLLNIDVIEASHHDIAVTALMTCQQRHHGIAYERFTQHGILALLPMWGAYQYRLVWTANSDYFLGISEEDKIAIIKAAFETRIGTMMSFQQQGHYPLKTVIAQQQATTHSVLLGDSAHRIYPVAAQGYNLAVRDIAMLIDILHEKKSLVEYVSQRKSDQQFTTTFTKGLEIIFGLHVPLLGHLRTMSLFAADLLPSVRRRIIQQILGQVGRQPSLLCEE